MGKIEIKNEVLCSGCGACAAACPLHCISMEPDWMGFCYPAVDASVCVECGKCETVCAAATVGRRSEAAPVRAYAARNSDGEVRQRSSSGGIFSLLAQWVLDKGGVVYGAALEDSCYGVRHVAAERAEELEKLRGSKYVQSRAEHTYGDVKIWLEEGRTVLFSGTPCQIDGLRAYLQTEYAELFLVEVACHGAPSPAIWRDYVQHLEREYRGKAVNVKFRDNGRSWKRYDLTVCFDHGKRYTKCHSDDLFMRGFVTDLYLRPSCYACTHKGFPAGADITLADYWGIGNCHPEMDDGKGTSLVIVHSAKGAALFENIKPCVCCLETDIERAAEHNPALLKPSVAGTHRDRFLEEYGKREFYAVMKQYCDVPLKRKLKRKIKAFLSRG